MALHPLCQVCGHRLSGHSLRSKRAGQCLQTGCKCDLSKLIKPKVRRTPSAVLEAQRAS